MFTVKLQNSDGERVFETEGPIELGNLEKDWMCIRFDEVEVIQNWRGGWELYEEWKSDQERVYTSVSIEGRLEIELDGTDDYDILGPYQGIIIDNEREALDTDGEWVLGWEEEEPTRFRAPYIDYSTTPGHIWSATIKPLSR
jgi:hypothetical protein